MSLLVGPNRIPVEPIAQVVRSYLEAEGTRLDDGAFAPASILPLAERVDVLPDTLDSWLKGDTATIDFDVADRLLCAMNLQDLWLTDLHDVYTAAPLVEGPKKFTVKPASGKRMCARVTCTETFIPKPKHPHQRFCSGRCAGAARRVKANPEAKIRGKGCILLKLECKKGHERTPENTGHTKDGRLYCLICKRKTDRENARRRYVPLGTIPDRRRKLTAELAAEVRAATGTYREIAARFGISRTTVSVVKTGKTWVDA